MHLNGKENATRPERGKELARYRIDMAALSESLLMKDVSLSLITVTLSGEAEGAE